MQKESGMKHLYRIGIFAAACAIIGFLIYYLYGQFKEEVQDLGDYPQIYADQKDMDYHKQLEEQQNTAGDGSAQTAVVKREFVSRQTVYILKEYDSNQDKLTISECEIPRQYLGMTREELEDELAVYERSPSLEDVSKGLINVTLEAFSGERIIICKTYYIEPEQECYLLTVEDHFVVVYYKNLDTLYCYTDICIDQLPDTVQEEILHIKRIETEEELYGFLESYSS